MGKVLKKLRKAGRGFVRESREEWRTIKTQYPKAKVAVHKFLDYSEGVMKNIEEDQFGLLATPKKDSQADPLGMFGPTTRKRRKKRRK